MLNSSDEIELHSSAVVVAAAVARRSRILLLDRLSLLLLRFLLTLGHASQPVEEERGKDVEDDVHPDNTKVSPAVICKICE